MMSTQAFDYHAALQDFRRARRRAALEQIMASLRGESVDLLSFEEVRKKLRAEGASLPKLREIPLDAIVGSVGRSTDFTRSFFPRHDSDEHRWAAVQTFIHSPEGVPPIEVYQLGEVYFVSDGNHRVSVARQMGLKQIEAYVTEIHIKVPLTPDTKPDELIMKAEYAEFLDHVRIDQLRPHADLSMTIPGKYRALEEHIRVHHYYMGLEQQRDVPYDEAVTHWYDEVYLPVFTMIRDRGLLRDFPEHTETDLYVWIAEHRAELEKQLGWQISPAAAASDLATRFSSKVERVISRIGETLIDVVTPDSLESGPAPGQWRQAEVLARREDRLFAGVLVPVNGQESGWLGLEQAIILARYEETQLYGLHIVTAEDQKESETAQHVRIEFEKRCQTANVAGTLAVEVGDMARKICDRAPWTDLIVLPLALPQGSQSSAKLKSSVRTIIQRSPRPILAIPQQPTIFAKCLLAYDGSPKADEALFVSAYIAGHWNIPLIVVTVKEIGRVSGEMLSLARDYLQHRYVEASFVETTGSVSERILEIAATYQCDLIIMGGYGHNPVVELVIGSALDNVLRTSHIPVLICR